MVENDYHVLWSHKGTFDIPSWYSKHMNESIRKNGDCLGENSLYPQNMNMQ